MSKSIRVSPADGTLYAVASREWGDATAWLALADANGLTDPLISTMMTILVPDYDPSFTGGVPQQ